MLKYRNGIVVFLLLISFQALSQQNTLTPDYLFKIKNVNQTAISPDGKFIAYTVIEPRPLTEEAGSNFSCLYVYDLQKSSSAPLLIDKVNVSSISWSADSKEIYFSSKLNNEKITQVYSINVTGGSPSKLFETKSSVLQYEISRDGSKIAFISLEDVNKNKSDLIAKGFDAEIYEEEFQQRNLYVVDLKSKEIKQVTTAVSVFEFTWNPDNKHIAAAIADKNLVDDSYMFKKIYYINTENGAKFKLVDNPGKLTELSISPNGQHLAFVSAANINDAVSGSLFITALGEPKAFNEIRNYTEGFLGSVIDVNWKDNSSVVYSAEEGVDITLSEQGIDEKERKILLEPGNVVFRSFEISDDLISFAGNTSQHPSELFSFNLSDNSWKKLTDNNLWLTEMKLAKQEKITYSARDGLQIEGVLTYPLNYSEDKKYPLIVYVHGGPESAVQNGWETGYSSWGQFAAAKDFFVFAPNYRASSGRGVEFTMMGFGDLAGKEFDDVVDGIDYLIDRGFVDKNKVGIGGGSYGGYFSAWASTKFTNRFAASVVFVGIANQVSKRNTTDIPYEDYYVHWGIWTHENEDLVWERSPVKYAHLSKTPTLILAGKEDPRVHPSQSLELYRALKLHSKAPVRLVFYPGQGHGNSKNTSRYDYLIRTLDWFEYYLKGNNALNKMPEKYPSAILK